MLCALCKTAGTFIRCDFAFLVILLGDVSAQLCCCHSQARTCSLEHGPPWRGKAVDAVACSSVPCDCVQPARWSAQGPVMASRRLHSEHLPNAHDCASVPGNRLELGLRPQRSHSVGDSAERRLVDLPPGTARGTLVQGTEHVRPRDGSGLYFLNPHSQEYPHSPVLWQLILCFLQQCNSS